MTAREKFNKMLEDRLMMDDAEQIVEVVYDFLNDEIENIKETEPYAVQTIREMETAAWVVWRMLDN